MEVPIDLKIKGREEKRLLRDNLRDHQDFGVKNVGVDLDGSEGANLPTDIETEPQTEIIQEP